MPSIVCRSTWPTSFFFFNDTATTEIYTLSLHDALPIYITLFPVQQTMRANLCVYRGMDDPWLKQFRDAPREDRKSTRLNSSHSQISYAVFCLKKKKQRTADQTLLVPLPHPRAGPHARLS